MLTRVITFFLAFILLWSGLSTTEAPHALAPASSGQQHALTHAIDRGVDHGGSVRNHHLDDLPAQVQNDPLTESPDLMPSPTVSGAPALIIVRRHSPTTATVASPALAGPFRPPSSAAFIA